MARDLLHIHNTQAWGELANLMPKDYGETPPVEQQELASAPTRPTLEQQELTCPKMREIAKLKAKLAQAEGELARHRTKGD